MVVSEFNCQLIVLQGKTLSLLPTQSSAGTELEHLCVILCAVPRGIPSVVSRGITPEKGIYSYSTRGSANTLPLNWSLCIVSILIKAFTFRVQ